MLVYVLLFNARTENEGIHTLKVEDRNIVLMFEDEDDATRFGLMLEAQDFPPATVESFEFEEIEEFCQAAGYECKQVPQGALATPPENNVEQTDWDPDQAPDADPAPSRPSSDEATLPQSELDRIRQQLEKLL
ncbi:MAG: DUF3110 domain-containing protein [Cyanobacteria bacterium Co-bin13]|nr:DUF3110 domain-containing protein [Cyanobacteria bacterium Co-bin13]